MLGWWSVSQWYFIHAKRKNESEIVGLVGSDSLTGWFHNHFIGVWSSTIGKDVMGIVWRSYGSTLDQCTLILEYVAINWDIYGYLQYQTFTNQVRVSQIVHDIGITLDKFDKTYNIDIWGRSFLLMNQGFKHPKWGFNSLFTEMSLSQKGVLVYS